MIVIPCDVQLHMEKPLSFFSLVENMLILFVPIICCHWIIMAWFNLCDVNF